MKSKSISKIVVWSIGQKPKDPKNNHLGEGWVVADMFFLIKTIQDDLGQTIENAPFIEGDKANVMNYGNTLLVFDKAENKKWTIFGPKTTIDIDLIIEGWYLTEKNKIEGIRLELKPCGA